jgi:trigger factor
MIGKKMDIELVDKVDNHVKYGIIYTHDDVKDCLEKEAEEMRPDVKVNGFRPGKVPSDYIIRMYGEKLRIQAMNKKVSNDIMTILKENKYDLASQPVYAFRPRQEIDDKNFYVELDLFLMPVLPEMNSETINIVKYQTNEESFQEILDKNLLMFQIMTADFDTIEDKPSEENDKVTFDIKITVDNEVLLGLSGKMQAILGQEQIPEEIEAQIKGKKCNEEIVYTHHYPDDAKELFSPLLIGKETLYTINIEKIERPIIKELDEDKVQKIGFRDYEHLFEILETNTRSTLDGLAFNKMRYDFFACLCELYKDIKLPEFILNQEAHHIAMNELSAKTDGDVMEKVTSGTFAIKPTDAHCVTAKKHIYISLFMKNYANKHNITVSDAELKRELEKRVSELTHLNSIKPDQKEQNYRDLSNKAHMIVLEQKVLNAVFDSLNLQEVLLSKDDYFEKIKIA